MSVIHPSLPDFIDPITRCLVDAKHDIYIFELIITEVTTNDGLDERVILRRSWR